MGEVPPRSSPVTTIDQLRTRISEEDFKEVWVDVSPPYETFLELVAARLPDVSQQLTATARLHGRNRIRVDGELSTTEADKTFYVELVWLPTFQTYRHGGSGISQKPPEIQPKSIGEFISALDAITGEEDLLLSAQAFLAGEGVDENDPDLPHAFPAIFALFERFPDESFDSPGMLISLMEDYGDYQEALGQSLARRPSLAGITLLERLLYTSLPPDEKGHWLRTLAEISQAVKAPGIVRELASEAIQRFEEV